MVNQIGIILGRLTNPNGRKHIQFPIYHDEIIKEFKITKLIGLNYIEWTVPKGKYDLFLGDFYAQGCLKNLIELGVPIKSIDLDYLKDLDLRQGYDLAFATDSLNWIANIASNIGCETLIIPIYEKNMNFLLIRNLISLVLERYNLKIAFEFLDTNSYTGINFINDVTCDISWYPENQRVGVCFDIGNNYYRDIISELKNYNKYNMLHHIHIKDKNGIAESIPLGKGVIDWFQIFNFLKVINYRGDFTLQVARGKDGEEIETVKKQVEFIKDLL